MTRFVYVLPAGRFRWEVRVDLSDLDLSHLSTVARAATPGPWRWTQFGAGRSHVYQDYPDAFDPNEVEIAGTIDRPTDAQFIATFDPPTALELVNLIDTEPQFYRLKRDALIAARAIAILIGGEVQPHDRRGVIQDPDSYGPDPIESEG